MNGILGLIILILDVIAVLEVVKSSVDGTKKTLWIALIVLLPVLGIILYFAVGRKDFKA
ncbi:MAG: PLDc_N domain-containing protein [Candidatus Omnitrophica bacterium]|nr:PLDc_N domain-containing protein [Candidatus Omnitrophota bacterium]